jgi:protein-disulfide isomerase
MQISQSQSKQNYSTPIAIILAGIIIAGALYFSNKKEAIAPQENPNIASIKNVNIKDNPFIGNPNAPVVMAVWSDYQCPACEYNERIIISALVDEYVKTGKLKIVFKDFAFLGLPQVQDSVNIALMGRAVWEAYPEKFYEWHKMIFANQGKGSDWASPAAINSLTKKVSGIDLAVITDLLSINSEKYKRMIDDDKQQGIRLGINATPSTIIADELIVGVPDYIVIKQKIDSLLD